MMEIVWIMLAGLCAYFKGRSTIAWVLGAYLVGWPAFVLVSFLRPNIDRLMKRANTLANLYLRLTEIKEDPKPEGYKDFNTVDDLMKQLQTK